MRMESAQVQSTKEHAQKGRYTPCYIHNVRTCAIPLHGGFTLLYQWMDTEGKGNTWRRAGQYYDLLQYHDIFRALAGPRFRVSDPHISAQSSKNLAARAQWTPQFVAQCTCTGLHVYTHTWMHTCWSTCSICPGFESRRRCFFRLAFFFFFPIQRNTLWVLNWCCGQISHFEFMPYRCSNLDPCKFLWSLSHFNTGA